MYGDDPISQRGRMVVEKSDQKMTYLQGSLCLDLLDHDVCKRLVKLERTVTFLTAQSAA
jgi:hypothetical protein